MCVASASLMSEHVRNLGFAEVLGVHALMRETLLGSDSTPWPPLLADFAALSHLRVNRARIPCALLPWHALARALSQFETPNVVDPVSQL
jgi:nitrogen fixation NifU-like protein